LAKKKKSTDPKQTSLFSFTEEKKSESKAESKPKAKNLKEREEKEKKVSLKEEVKPKEASKKVPKKREEEKIKKEMIKKESPFIKIPEELFFKGNNEPFGLKKGNIRVERMNRESFTSQYIRFLKERGEIAENLERGLLLDVDYDGVQNKAYCKFYDLDTDEVRIWIDTTNHIPYCITKDRIVDLESNIELTNYDGFIRLEEIKKIDLLRDKEIPMTKIYGKTPTNIGGSGKNIKNILGKGKAWEADIRYHLNYIYDRGLIPGLIYKITDGKLEKIDFKDNSKDSESIINEMLDLFKEEAEEMQEFAKRNLELFLTPIPDVKRMALDIEIDLGPEDYLIPNPRQALQKIISISFVATDGLKLVYILERKQYSYKKPHKKFPADAKIVFFKQEKDLVEETFRLMWNYPIIITFNGDNFDLTYLFHRARILKINRDLNPIQVKRGFGVIARTECDLRKGLHLDIFNFFFNRSISGYAFGGAYQSNSLNAISDALLGKEKYQHEEEIHEMEYDILAWYNLKDSLLTLELTKFNNSLVWNLIILLIRITKLPFHEMVRRQISTWIQSIFYFEHRTKNYLIPRRREISELKKGGFGKSIIEGKGFKGAFVIPPVPGIHYDVVVMDFASLYPSIIKEFNLSYETVLCPHDDCQENLIKGIPYYVCTHKMGIFAYVVGFFRDIRVKFFKPKSGDKLISETQRSYYNTIQQALKVFINGSYGVFGSENFPLYCKPVAESTTGIGRYSIKKTVEKAEKMGVKVLYGDSITGDTPLLLKKDNKIFIKSIDTITNNWIKEGMKEISLCDYEVWSENGFVRINKVIRHKTDKKIFRIVTHTGVVDVTEDHSLLTSKAEIIKPTELEIGCELLHSFPKEFPEDKSINLSKEEAFVFGLFYADGSAVRYDPKWNYKYSWAINNENIQLLKKISQDLNRIERNNRIQFEILNTMESSKVYKLVPIGSIKRMVEKYRELFYSKRGLKKIPDLILNSSKEIKTSFFEGYCSGNGNILGKKEYGITRLDNKGKIGAMGLYFILKSLGFDVRINIKENKPQFYRLNATKSYQRKNPAVIKKIIPLGNLNGYVYDLETENHHFHAGIGQLIVHNTDSVFLLNPSKDQLEEISKWSKDELDLDLEEEKTYQFLALSDRKKNYIGIYKDTKYVDIKGLMAKKRNTPDFVKKIFKDLTEVLKDITNDEEFAKAKKDIINNVKDNMKKIGKKDTFSLEDYAIRISMQKKLDHYDKVMPQHVRAANELRLKEIDDVKKTEKNERKAKSLINAINKKYDRGYTVSIIKTKGPVGAKAVELTKLQDIDIKKYRELLQSALEQVLDALGISFEEIKGMKKMDAFF